jgi:hypothetical protein
MPSPESEIVQMLGAVLAAKTLAAIDDAVDLYMTKTVDFLRDRGATEAEIASAIAHAKTEMEVWRITSLKDLAAALRRDGEVLH